MSAWDITGLLVWSPLAFFFWRTALLAMDYEDEKDKPTPEWAVSAIVFSLLPTLAAVFCFARLLGAHA